MKTIKQDGITYVYRYVRARGQSWAYGYYPQTEIEKQAATKKKRTKKQILSDKSIKLWSQIIHRKFNNTCQMCGKSTGVMNAHHLLTKGSCPEHKYNTKNGILLCVNCHKYDKGAPHVSPEQFSFWFSNKYPEWYKDIMLMKFAKPKKRNIEDVYNELKKEAKELGI